MKKIPENTCVAICTPHYDRPHLRYMRSLGPMWKPTRAAGAMIPGAGTHKFDVVGKPISVARNEMTRDALLSSPKVTHVLWIDNDMEFGPEALKILLEHDVPIVGGLCHSRHFPYHPILAKTHHDGRKYGFVFHYPPNTLFEVEATGGAFLLVKREVYELMNAAGFEMSWWSERDGLSEDFSFCELARSLGYKVYVDTGLEIGHVTEIVMNSRMSKLLRPFDWNAWVPDPGVSDGAPRATIVIPTYNQNPKWLKKAVYSASHQTVPVEVIIVDDGSNPPVPFTGWPENVRVIRHIKDKFCGPNAVAYSDDPNAGELVSENRGISAALNTGIKAMTTKKFCWLSSDDLLDPRKVQMQLAHMRDTDGKLSFHRYQQISD
jgi:hypothetical protein